MGRSHLTHKRAAARRRAIARVAHLHTGQELAKMFGVTYSTALTACREAGKLPRKPKHDRNANLDPKWRKADWSKHNNELAAELGVSRQRVEQVRAALGKPKVLKYRPRTSPNGDGKRPG